MLCITLLKTLPGKYTDAIRLFKNPHMPPGVKVREYLAVFGDYDCIIVYEAASEEAAAEFVVQFGEIAQPSTMVAFPVEKLKWTR